MQPAFGNSDPATNGERWLWSKLQPSVKMVFDVGVQTALTYPPTGTFIQHCFEPNPAFYRLLAPHASEKVIINPVGLGSAPGTFDYYQHSESTRTRAHYGCPKDCPCKMTIVLTTLDAYCQDKKIDHIDFLKIDTEGFELEVLKGASRMLPHIDLVQFEYGGTYPDNNITLADVYAFLRKHGFTHFYMICPHYLLEMPEPLENFQYANYLAAKRSVTF